MVTTDDDLMAEHKVVARRLFKKFLLYPPVATEFPRRIISPSADDLSAWDDCGDGRLMGPAIMVAGTAIHLEAIEVEVFKNGSMRVKNEQDDESEILLNALEHQIDSAHETVEFSGRIFVIYATPSPAGATSV